jgi:transcriptional regulator with XRE-family HTH domain
MWEKDRCLVVTKLAILRFERGLTQRCVAEKLGFSPSVLAQVERRRTALWPSCLKKFSDFYGVPPEAIVDEEGFARRLEVGV